MAIPDSLEILRVQFEATPDAIRVTDPSTAETSWSMRPPRMIWVAGQRK
jgi:hypothetical protein